MIDADGPIDDLERRLVRLLRTVVRLRGTEDRLRALVAASLAVTVDPDPDLVLQESVDRARALLGARSAAIRLRDHDGWSAPLTSGPHQGDGVEPLLEAVEGAVRPVLAAGLLGVAVRVRGAVVAVLTVAAAPGPAPTVGFDEEDAQLLAAFAEAVGSALGTAWQRRALEADAVRADTTAEVLARLAATVCAVERIRSGEAPAAEADEAVSGLEGALRRMRGVVDDLARDA